MGLRVNVSGFAVPGFRAGTISWALSNGLLILARMKQWHMMTIQDDDCSVSADCIVGHSSVFPVALPSAGA